MRILDKNTDFYDYYQNIYIDNSVTFDRTNSFLLSKEMVLHYLTNFGSNRSYINWLNTGKYRFRKEKLTDYLLLQICNDFWLFESELIRKENSYDYEIRLLTKWKNYNLSRKLISFDIIQMDCMSFYVGNRHKEDTSTLVAAVNNKQYKVLWDIGNYVTSVNNKKVEKTIPILVACGINNLVNDLDIYLAFEEYFSLEKQSTERCESKGLTDSDKIENHGFDKKSSFRGKNN